MGVRYVAKLAERRSCRLRPCPQRQLGKAQGRIAKGTTCSPAAAGLRQHVGSVRHRRYARFALVPRSGVEVEVDSFFLPRRRIASDLVRERRRFDNKKRAVVQVVHVHGMCMRGAAITSPHPGRAGAPRRAVQFPHTTRRSRECAAVRGSLSRGRVASSGCGE